MFTRQMHCPRNSCASLFDAIIVVTIHADAMSSANIEQGITFGPFRMPHLSEQVNDRFRRAFYSYLSREVMPSLDGQIMRIEGRVVQQQRHDVESVASAGATPAASTISACKH